MLSLSRLRMLRELHRLGTLAEVARALSYTPSAISQQLSLLERECRVTLLERVGRRVRLTDEALTLVAHTEEVLAQLERAEAELATANQRVSGTLKVASFQTVVLSFAPTALTLMAERHPDVTVEITQREVGPAFDGLLSHDFDLILGEEYPGMPEPVRDGVDRAELLSDPLRLVLPQSGPLSTRPRVLRDLADAPWAFDPVGAPTGAWARMECRAAGFEPTVRFDTPDPLMHAHLARTGHAVAFIPALIAAQYLGGTQIFGLPGDPQRMLFTAVRAGRSAHPAVRAFRECLAEAARWEEPPSPVHVLEASERTV
ncbi:LysR family transcriptional regulator [Microbacterium sp. MPKO10]|uniref:LysR family transcriptional regulator n=1 Tax=Microbacterium sp. MPKO10 TaxID=2989818 RepID=UPI0022367A21|nr:LysR family transcriptional regulator [Microbacterium sp. MPKO10]MCW4456741.1 LysR family transcriptional regulator [Microbacterium sp. MPKO10]